MVRVKGYFECLVAVAKAELADTVGVMEPMAMFSIYRDVLMERAAKDPTI